MTQKPASQFVYVTYIRTTPQQLWSALTSAEFIRQYWFGCNVESEWRAGASWKLSFADGRPADAGEIVELEPGKKLVIRWRNEWKAELKEEGWSLCTMELEPVDTAVKLTVTHSMQRDNSKFIEAVSGGWPRILSNLKTLLETGLTLMPVK